MENTTEILPGQLRRINVPQALHPTFSVFDPDIEPVDGIALVLSVISAIPVMTEEEIAEFGDLELADIGNPQHVLVTVLGAGQTGWIQWLTNDVRDHLRRADRGSQGKLKKKTPR